MNRVGGERRSIPDRPNTGSQTMLCELGRCHDGETNHPISTFLGVFSSHSLSIASKPPSKVPLASEISSIVYRRSSLFCSRIFRHSRRYDFLTGAQNEDKIQRSFLHFRNGQTTRKLVYGSVLPP